MNGSNSKLLSVRPKDLSRRLKGVPLSIVSSAMNLDSTSLPTIFDRCEDRISADSWRRCPHRVLSFQIWCHRHCFIACRITFDSGFSDDLCDASNLLHLGKITAKCIYSYKQVLCIAYNDIGHFLSKTFVMKC
jgi:hypothetical protein